MMNWWREDCGEYNIGGNWAVKSVEDLHDVQNADRRERERGRGETISGMHENREEAEEKSNMRPGLREHDNEEDTEDVWSLKMQSLNIQSLNFDKIRQRRTTSSSSVTSSASSSSSRFSRDSRNSSSALLSGRTEGDRGEQEIEGGRIEESVYHLQSKHLNALESKHTNVDDMNYDEVDALQKSIEQKLHRRRFEEEERETTDEKKRNLYYQEEAPNGSVSDLYTWARDSAAGEGAEGLGWTSSGKIAYSKEDEEIGRKSHLSGGTVYRHDNKNSNIDNYSNSSRSSSHRSSCLSGGEENRRRINTRDNREHITSTDSSNESEDSYSSNMGGGVGMSPLLMYNNKIVRKSTPIREATKEEEEEEEEKAEKEEYKNKEEKLRANYMVEKGGGNCTHMVGGAKLPQRATTLSTQMSEGGVDAYVDSSGSLNGYILEENEEDKEKEREEGNKSVFVKMRLNPFTNEWEAVGIADESERLRMQYEVGGTMEGTTPAQGSYFVPPYKTTESSQGKTQAINGYAEGGNREEGEQTQRVVEEGINTAQQHNSLSFNTHSKYANDINDISYNNNCNSSNMHVNDSPPFFSSASMPNAVHTRSSSSQSLNPFSSSPACKSNSNSINNITAGNSSGTNDNASLHKKAYVYRQNINTLHNHRYHSLQYNNNVVQRNSSNSVPTRNSLPPLPSAYSRTASECFATVNSSPPFACLTNNNDNMSLHNGASAAGEIGGAEEAMYSYQAHPPEGNSGNNKIPQSLLPSSSPSLASPNMQAFSLAHQQQIPHPCVSPFPQSSSCYTTPQGFPSPSPFSNVLSTLPFPSSSSSSCFSPTSAQSNMIQDDTPNSYMLQQHNFQSNHMATAFTQPPYAYGGDGGMAPPTGASVQFSTFPAFDYPANVDKLNMTRNSINVNQNNANAYSPTLPPSTAPSLQPTPNEYFAPPSSLSLHQTLHLNSLPCNNSMYMQPYANMNDGNNAYGDVSSHMPYGGVPTFPPGTAATDVQNSAAYESAAEYFGLHGGGKTVEESLGEEGGGLGSYDPLMQTFFRGDSRLKWGDGESSYGKGGGGKKKQQMWCCTGGFD